ncbi:MAG: flippase-like domain-containing protein [Desulfarculaceae bacterium]|nr:flippase-like domain-containing protein [Desulfarculaceae bacterium]
MNPNQTKPKRRRATAWLSLVAAALVTGGLLYYLARATTLDDWVRLYQGLAWSMFGAYLACFLGSMLLKALRYRILLDASGEGQAPRYRDLLTLTFVSNLFVDLLPARSGSLAYIVFLNRKLEVGLPACFSSFAFSFIFDLIGMLPLFFTAIILYGVAAGQHAPLLWALLAVLAVIALLALFLLEKVLALGEVIVAWLAQRLPGRLGDWGWRGAQELGAMASDVSRIKGQGVYGRVLVVSVAIRALKYLGLYLLVVGLAAQWPAEAARLSFPLILFALVAAEATASLPVSGIAGFGAYEGVMMATLRGAGLAPTQAALIPFGLHLLTQTVDYLLGGVALIVLSLIKPRNGGEAPAAHPKRRRWLAWLVALGAAAVLLVGGVHFGPRLFYQHFGGMVLAPVGGGLSPEQQALISAQTQGLKAKVVWSSSRSGNHELYLLTLPELKLYRLTSNDRVDYYARFSPDGKRLVFARSQKPWVSERDEIPWDAYVLDLASGKESLAANNANYPQWAGEGKISFMRGGQTVLKDLATGKESVIYDASGPPVQGVAQTPELSPDGKLLAFTARGKQRGTMVYDLASKELRTIAGGCEITWFPGGQEVLWVENGGHGGNQILASRLSPVKPRVFMDLPGAHSHEYFPRLSPDGRWLVWGASAKGHEHDIADYEIFLWKVGTPWEKALRLSRNAANDRWPDIFIEK